MAGSLLPLGRAPIRPFRSSSSYGSEQEVVPCRHSPLNPSPLSRQRRRTVNLNLLFVGAGRSISPLRHRLKPIPALESDGPSHTIHQEQRSVKSKSRSESLEKWDSLTAKFAGASNMPFLLLQLPQIVLNARNLLAGNKTALLAVPWLGMFTGLVGNLTLLSYFAKKREKEVVVVQTLGVVSIYVVIAQLAMAEAMPLPHFLVTSVVVATGLVINFMYYFGLLGAGIWRVWEDFITIAGLSVLPQVMWSTFVPYIPNSVLPGAVAFVTAVVSVVMARLGKLSEKAIKFIGSTSGWTATLLFMWMPVAQMWTNFLNPDNIKGLSAFSMLLAMIGNGLMIPRALFIRDLMWFTGSTWATVFYGWGNLICLYWNCSLEGHQSVWIQFTTDIYKGFSFWTLILSTVACDAAGVALCWLLHNERVLLVPVVNLVMGLSCFSSFDTANWGLVSSYSF